jgi:hypothetical protein
MAIPRAPQTYMPIRRTEAQREKRDRLYTSYDRARRLALLHKLVDARQWIEAVRARAKS